MRSGVVFSFQHSISGPLWASRLSNMASQLHHGHCLPLPRRSSGPSDRLEAPRNPQPWLSLIGSTMLGSSWLWTAHFSPPELLWLEADAEAQMTPGLWLGNSGPEM